MRAGKCVAIYPEGTLTRDPDLWPMRGKTGAARVALDDPVPGHPGRPVGAAGDPGALRQAAAPLPRKTMQVSAGPPVTSTTCTASESPAGAAEATERIMAAITRRLEVIRGEKAPAERLRPPQPHGVHDDRQAAAARMEEAA